MSSLTDVDCSLLRRAVRLAMQGRGAVEPNPMVGCVIAWPDGRVIGEGYHARFGGPHAEPTALAACGAESPAGATAYVTLEPCCHANKKTPPCVPALLAARIARIVVGCIDPNPPVAGRGIAQLRAAGVRVDEADDAECKQLLAPFVANLVHHRPYVTLKWAQSSDGKIAGPNGKPARISNERSHRLVHALRARCDAILVGLGTVLADDPLLTVRGIAAPARPLMRVVLDSDLRLPVDSQLVRTVDRGRVIVLCSKEAADYSGTRAVLAASGVEVHAIPADAPGRLNLQRAVETIGALGVSHLLVEPGPTLARSFLDGGPWDRAWLFRSQRAVGNDSAPAAAADPPNAVASVDIDGDTLTEHLNPAGAYFGKFPSADFLSLAGT